MLQCEGSLAHMQTVGRQGGRNSMEEHCAQNVTETYLTLVLKFATVM